MGKDLKDIQKQVEAENKEADDLLRSLEIPQYTNRRLEAHRVKSKDKGSIHSDRGWISGASDEVLSLLNEGDPYILETSNNTISGYIINGKWYDRKSDQDLKRQHEVVIKNSRERYNRYVEDHREEWLKREEALPDWLKVDMAKAHEDPEFEKDLMRWGYALMICELAAMYAKTGLENLEKDYWDVESSDEIEKFSQENGTSGNQHGVSMAMAKRYLTEGK